MSSLQEQLNQAWKDALRAGDALRRDTLSGLRAAVKNAEINARTADSADTAMDDATVQAVIEREAKKRRDAIEEYQKANRPDRAEAEANELQILQEFLPAPLSDEELETLVREAIAESGAQSIKDMGRAMQTLMPKIAGRADGKKASALIKQLLQ